MANRLAWVYRVAAYALLAATLVALAINSIHGLGETRFLFTTLSFSWIALTLLGLRRGAGPGRSLRLRDQLGTLEISILVMWLVVFAGANIAFVSILSRSVGLSWTPAAALVVALGAGWAVRWRFDELPAGVLLPTALLVGMGGTLAVLLVVDLFARFDYALLLVILTYVGAVLSIACINCFRLFRSTRWGRSLVNTAWLTLFAGVVVMFLSSTNLSALGSYRLFTDDGPYELRPSSRGPINSRGLRGPEVAVPKPTGTYRISVLGDSSVYGWMVPEPQTFARVLERRLNESANGMRYEVVNAGVPGYDLESILERLRRHVLPLEPDLIDLVTGANDSSVGRGDEGAQHRQGFPRMLESLTDSVASAGARLVLCSYPHASDYYVNRLIRDAVERSGAPLVDLFAIVNAEPDVYFIDGHPNLKGNRLIGEALYRTIRAEVLPGSASRGTSPSQVRRYESLPFRAS